MLIRDLLTEAEAEAEAEAEMKVTMRLRCVQNILRLLQILNSADDAYKD
jgi:hypothetical protein